MWKVRSSGRRRSTGVHTAHPMHGRPVLAARGSGAGGHSGLSSRRDTPTPGLARAGRWGQRCLRLRARDPWPLVVSAVAVGPADPGASRGPGALGSPRWGRCHPCGGEGAPSAGRCHCSPRWPCPQAGSGRVASGSPCAPRFHVRSGVPGPEGCDKQGPATHRRPGAERGQAGVPPCGGCACAQGTLWGGGARPPRFPSSGPQAARAHIQPPCPRGLPGRAHLDSLLTLNSQV